MCAPLNLRGAQGQAFVRLRTELGLLAWGVFTGLSRQSGECGERSGWSVELQGVWESSEFRSGLPGRGEGVFLKEGG